MNIKTLVLGGILMCILQQKSTAQISFGFQGGVTFFKYKNVERSNILNYPTYDVVMLDGIYESIFIEIPIKNNFSIYSELSYTRKGVAQNGKNEYSPQIPENTRRETRMDYVGIPLMAKYRLPLRNNKLHFDFGAGISVEYLIEMSYWVRRGSDKRTEKIPVNTGYGTSNFRYNRFDVASIMDVSFGIRTDVGDFALGTRASLDMTDIYHYKDEAGFRIDEKLYNWGAIIYLRYSLTKFHFKRAAQLRRSKALDN